MHAIVERGSGLCILNVTKLAAYLSSLINDALNRIPSMAQMTAFISLINDDTLNHTQEIDFLCQRDAPITHQ